MTAFRLLLWLLFALIGLYTLATFATAGPDFISPFLAPLPHFGWAGQFHLDFALYLLLSGLWVAWRSHFTAFGIACGLLAATFGMLILAPLLLLFLARAEGDPRRLLLGDRAD